jgi:hypothetical protein
MQRNLAALKQGGHANGEWLAALVALVEALTGALSLHLADALDAATVRANRTFGPNARFDIREGGVLVVKVRC